MTFEAYAADFQARGIDFSNLMFTGQTSTQALHLAAVGGKLRGTLEASNLAVTAQGTASATLIHICIPGTNVCWDETTGGTQAIASQPHPGLASFVFEVDFVGHAFKMESATPFTFAGDSNTPPFTATWSFAGTLTNEPPKAVTASSLTVECSSPNLGRTTLDGSRSTDPDGDLANFVWWKGPVIFGSQVGRGPVLTTDIPFNGSGPTTTEFTLAVADRVGQVDTASVAVTVVDTTPPVLTAVSAVPSCLWPPNHKYVPYELGKNLFATITDSCDSSPSVRVVNITSSEPDNGLGDGDTANDAVFDHNRFCLRSERSGGGRGRTYTVTLEAVDGAGNRSLRQLVIGVGVAHDQGSHSCDALSPSAFVDDGDPRCVFQPHEASPLNSTVDGGVGGRHGSAGCTSTSGAVSWFALPLVLLTLWRRRSCA